MRVVTLIENTTSREDLVCEHGLSLYVQTGNQKILFDTGQSGAFADNAQRLGIDLRRVDFVVLSHGHYDHGGGLRRFLEINSTAPIYLHRQAFGDFRHGKDKYIGLDPSLLESGRLIFVDDVLEVGQGVCLHGYQEEPVSFPVGSGGLQVLRQGRLVPDEFCHEIYMVIRESGRRFCFSGCSHRGVANILHWSRPDVFFGGFHLSKLEDPMVLDTVCQSLVAHPGVYYTGHCTGHKQFDWLKKGLGDRLQVLTTGAEVVI